MIDSKDERSYLQKRLYIYHFINDGITFVLPVLMVSLYFEFNLDWFQIGLIFAFNSLATIIFQLIVGYFTDQNNNKILMLCGLFLLSLSSFLMIISFDFVSLLIFAIISGIALSFQHSISYATTSRMYQEKSDIMIGRQGAAGDLGKCIAVFSSALLLIIFSSWKLVLLTWAFICLLIFIVITINLRNITFEEYFNHDNVNEINVTNKVEKELRKMLIILVFIIFILFLAIYSLLIINLAVYLRVEKTGIVSEYSGLIMGYALIFGVIGAYFSGSMKNKYGMTNSLIFFSILMIAVVIIYILLDTSDLIINLLFYALLGFLLFLLYPQLLAAINDCFHHKKIGFGYGIVLSCGWFGNFIGFLIGGYFANLYSAIMFFIISIIFFVIIIVLSLIIKINHNL
ncbi:MAG: MFS transporter [Promethearchaeota archaeon]